MLIQFPKRISNKMKKSFYLLTIILVSTIIYMSSCTQGKRNTSLEQQNIKGRVSKIIETSYRVDIKFGEIEKGNLKKKTTTKYDERGNRIENITIDEPIIKNGIPSSILDLVPELDSSEKLITSTLSNDWYSTNKYDIKGNMTERMNYHFMYNSDPKETYEYIEIEFDKEGNWLKRIEYGDGRLKYVTTRAIEYY